jgi:2-dehydro-3-deoxyphosphooctonate aldolase (KDO 8-P synthase)
MACERGASFGYNNLVSDMRSLAIMRETGAGRVRCHPLGAAAGRQGHLVGRQREMVPVLSRAAVAVGVAACSWKPIPILQKHCRTAPTPCRWAK